MARRALAGRDQKIIQGQRRDEFFARMKRKGGVPRMPNQGATTVSEEPDATADELETAAEATVEETPEGEAAEAPRENVG